MARGVFPKFPRRLGLLGGARREKAAPSPTGSVSQALYTRVSARADRAGSPRLVFHVDGHEHESSGRWPSVHTARKDEERWPLSSPRGSGRWTAFSLETRLVARLSGIPDGDVTIIGRRGAMGKK